MRRTLPRVGARKLNRLTRTIVFVRSSRGILRNESFTRSRARRTRGIAENSHCGIAPIYADHAASRMRACSAQVDARHGRARRKPAGPHIGRQALTLKNVTAGESDLLLNVRGAKRLRI